MKTIKTRFAEWSDFTKEGILAFYAQELTLLADAVEDAPRNEGLRGAAAIIRAHAKDLEGMGA